MKKRKIAAIVLAGVCSISALITFSGCDALLGTADYEQWSANIAQTTLTSAVIVEKVNYSTGAKAQGSGMIFYESATHYYALTNNHVVYKSAGEISVGYEAIDCFDNAYMSAKVVHADADYDLAVISFQKKEETDLHVSALAEKNPVAFDQVALISNPQGRHNATTFGRVYHYSEIQLGDTAAAESNVQFSVIGHNCFSMEGSSGGAVVNMNLEIVGVHYACGYAEDDSFVEGYAIPVEMVRLFLADAEIAADIELGV